MKKIILNNFKCFEEQEINFSNLTILAGANGSGKSTVIQAILLFLQSTNSRNAFIDSLVLNDYFLEAGMASDILYENAKEDFVSFEIFFDDKKSFLYKYNIKNRENRILSSEDSKKFNEDLKQKIIKPPEELIARLMQLGIEFISTDFISADRYGPKLTYKINNEDTKVGKYGEYTPYIIDQHKNDILQNKNVYFNNTVNNSSLLSEVNNWLSHILDGVKIDTSVIDNANISILKVTNYPQSILDFRSPIHMPYGASYVLPIIVSCLLNSNTKQGKVIVENPEAHLHPSAQSKLGKFLSKIANAGVQVIIETHSDHIINGIRIAIKNKEISNKKVVFNSFSRGEALGENVVEEISIQENGKLSRWPDGFF
ncbi:MAG: DUF3696 domain-containing protein [Sulfurimonas sp.]|nr:DUF3696 domain-containing protein [Sulfurimonas sp.]